MARTHHDGHLTAHDLSGPIDAQRAAVAEERAPLSKTPSDRLSAGRGEMIFIPLTFIAGIYGMNFEVMPELHSAWGYPAVLLAMSGAAVGMLAYFRHRRWIGSPGRGSRRDR